jgi:tetratricopeptide (TPR) repeat protein
MRSDSAVTPQLLQEAIQAVDFLLKRSSTRYPECLSVAHPSRLTAWRTGETSRLNELYPADFNVKPELRNASRFEDLNPLQRELELHRCYAEALLVAEQLHQLELDAEKREELVQRALGILPSSEARRFGEIHSCAAVQPRQIADSTTTLLQALELVTQEMGAATALAYGMFIVAGLRARTEFEKYGQRLDTLFNRIISAPEVMQVLDMVTLNGRRAGFEPQFRLLLAVREQLWKLKPHRLAPTGFLLTKIIDAYLSNRPNVGNLLGITILDSIIIGKLGFEVRYIYEDKKLCLETLIDTRSVYWDPAQPTPLSFTPIVSGKRLQVSDLIALIYASLANSYFTQTFWDKAIENYEKVIELIPDSTETYTDIAVCYLRKNLPDKAIVALQQALKLTPNSPTTHHILGNAYAMANQWRLAVASYKKAIQHSPKFPEAWYNMGLAYEKLEMFDQAVAAFQMATELKPDYTPAYLALGNLALERSQPKEAIKHYRELLKHDPNNVAAYYNIGRAYYELKELDNAIQFYQKAVKINPKHAGAWYNLGIAYRDKGQKEKAVQALEQAIALNPNLLR